MTSTASPSIGRRVRQAGVAMALVAGLTLAAAPATFAAKPVTEPITSEPIEFPAGEPCGDPTRFENLKLTGTTTTFPPSRNGSTLIVSAGTGKSLVTNQATGGRYAFAGWFVISTVIFADGSARVDAVGTDFIVWYLAGDPSELGPGLYRVEGHATEWYDADGAMVRATASGRVTDLCAKVGA